MELNLKQSSSNTSSLVDGDWLKDRSSEQGQKRTWIGMRCDAYCGHVIHLFND